MEKKSFKPQLESVNKIQEFVEKSLIKKKSDEKEIFRINILIEEIVVNIIKYAFKDVKKGNINIEIDATGDNILLKIIDDGIPFNLIKAKTPDIKAPLEDRNPGGLGIFFVKQIAKHIEYSYKNNKNCISLVIEP